MQAPSCPPPPPSSVSLANIRLLTALSIPVRVIVITIVCTRAAGRMSYMKAIDQWLKKTGMPEARLGLLAAANPQAVARIRAGTAQVQTLNAVLSYIRKNPPARSTGRSSSTS